MISEETREKMSKSKMGNKNGAGKKMTEENKEKLRKVHLGRKASPETIKRLSESHKGYKAKPETLKKMSERMLKNPIKYWLGKSFSEEHLKKLSDSSKGRKHTLEARKKCSESKLGEKNPQWKGGITKTDIGDIIRRSYEYRQWRSDVFTRDSFTCQTCGIMGCYLEAHHIKGLADIVYENRIDSLECAVVCMELWNINNGTTLCRNCHLKTMGKGK